MDKDWIVINDAVFHDSGAYSAGITEDIAGHLSSWYQKMTAVSPAQAQVEAKALLLTLTQATENKWNHALLLTDFLTLTGTLKNHFDPLWEIPPVYVDIRLRLPVFYIIKIEWISRSDNQKGARSSSCEFDLLYSGFSSFRLLVLPPPVLNISPSHLSIYIYIYMYAFEN